MKVIIAVSLLLFTLPSFCQQDTAVHAMEEVVITAQRKGNKALLTPYSVTSVNRQYLDKINPRTTPEALSGMNGVFVQKTNHGGGSAFLRGLTGNQTLMLVDGIRLNNSTFRYGPNQYLNTVNPFSIERIEIIKGTGSVQYGSDALGGVIHIITADPQFSEKKVVRGKAMVRAVSGSMERTVSGQAVYASTNTGITMSFAYRNFGDLAGGDTTGRQSPSGYNEWSANAKAKFAIGTKTRLVLAHQFVEQQHVPVYHKMALENYAINEMDPQRRLLTYARMQVESERWWTQQLAITASWQHTVEGRNSRRNGSSILKTERDKVNTIGLTADVLSGAGRYWTANSGVELYFDNVRSAAAERHIENGTYVPKRGLYPDDAIYTNNSLYSIHHFNFQRWIVDAGARLNVFNIRIPDTTVGKTAINPFAVVGNIAILYRLFPHQNLYAAFSSGYRAPNVDDMGTLGIVDFRYETPALDLKPERSRHFELGYKFSSGKISGNVAAYYMYINDLITRIKVNGQLINGYQVYKKENSERAFIRGLEAELNWQVNKRWRASGSLACAYGQNLTRKEPLRRIPPSNGRITASYQHLKWYVLGEWQFAGAQHRLAQGDKDDNRIPQGGTPGWNVLNLYAGRQWKGISFNLSLLNLLNEDYRTHGSGINGMGRAAMLAVNYNFN